MYDIAVAWYDTSLRSSVFHVFHPFPLLCKSVSCSEVSINSTINTAVEYLHLRVILL